MPQPGNRRNSGTAFSRILTPMGERILMIEDDESLSAMLKEYLAPLGMELSARATARAGLDALADDAYDALILDVMLPDGDGFDVCRRVRGDSDIPILMLTARGDETDRIVGLELGADDYLPKPFNPRELLARLRAILRRKLILIFSTNINIFITAGTLTAAPRPSP